MTRRNLAVPVVVLVLATLVSPSGVVPAGAQESAIEPEATRLLKRMTDYVSDLQRFSVDTDNMLEDVLVTGQKIQYDFTSTVKIQRPDKLRVERTGDLLRQVLVYDGKNLTIHNPQDNYFATTDAPDNIDDLLHFARDTLDIVPPTGDMIYTNAYELLTAGVIEGFVVGKSMVDGVRCDHLAFRTPLVDWQIWISDGDQPLPHKYVLTTMDDPAHPQYLVLMSEWDVSPRFDAADFSFNQPVGAQQIEFLRMDAGQWTTE
jgi:hypothetical protein